ncbi:MAG: hydantoinase B/oxoprolinase family protein [Proteobacteria bacterium]|nr:hydantoinase B/oxoprolinase family protein [Pseudomonadota bacterium]
MTIGTNRVFSPIAMEVFSNRLLSITEDMGNTLIRSSFSTNIKERRDCSVGMFDAAGRLIAQASHVPLHLGSLMGGVDAVLKSYRLADMKAGDAFICNDPYLAGGTHMPDISIVSPVVIDGAVRFFTANIAHHSDVGGAVPGSISGAARTVFEEGIRIPAIRIADGGKIIDDVMRLIVSNTREPDERLLDLRVQVATNARGVAMAQQLAAKMGLDEMLGSVDDLLAYTGRRLRSRIAALAEGEYTCTSYLDDDGQGGDPVAIVATARIAGDELTLDFAGTAPQARGAVNVPESALRATVYYSIKTLLDPGLPPNGGMCEAIRITAPEGCLVNPRYPAAVGARSITCNKIARAIFGAFAPLLPDDSVMAAGHDAIPAIVFSGQRRGGAGPFVYLETIGGGAGARANEDGMDAVHVHMTNTSNLPAEALEHEYPLMVDEYGLVPDSSGAGKHRGGVGITRQIRALQDDIIFSIRSDSHVIAAPGVFGGGDGGTADLIQNAGRPDAQQRSSKSTHIELQAGESMRLETAGGGGYGAPETRDPRALARDISDGVLSRARAEQDYGKALVAQALALNVTEDA